MVEFSIPDRTLPCPQTPDRHSVLRRTLTHNCRIHDVQNSQSLNSNPLETWSSSGPSTHLPQTWDGMPKPNVSPLLPDARRVPQDEIEIYREPSYAPNTLPPMKSPVEPEKKKLRSILKQSGREITRAKIKKMVHFGPGGQEIGSVNSERRKMKQSYRHRKTEKVPDSLAEEERGNVKAGVETKTEPADLLDGQLKS